ncbi:MAG: hypothetical protein ABIQ10_12760 [Gemmatimonadaceae bacterium]
MVDDVRFQRGAETPVRTETWKLLIAWPFVLIPLLLGLSQTVIKSAAMFK